MVTTLTLMQRAINLARMLSHRDANGRTFSACGKIACKPAFTSYIYLTKIACLCLCLGAFVAGFTLDSSIFEYKFQIML